MPEGPEIRRAADRIARALAGHPVQRVFFGLDALRGWERRLQGQVLDGVDTIGKHMLCRFEDGTRIYSHNQLYGRWWVRRRDDYPDTRRQLRLALHTRRHSALLYSASDIDVIRHEDFPVHPRLASLGPDPLHADVNEDVVRDRLGQLAFSRRRLAGLLLDQGFLAGLGNYLRSEILFAARTSPLTRPMDCDQAGIRRISRAIIGLMQRSYRTGGVTNSPSRVKRLQSQGCTRSEYRFAVFGRAGNPCHVCGETIIRQDLAGRRLYSCPDCQQGAGV